MGLETAIIVGLTATAAAGAVGAMSSVQQGAIENRVAEGEARQTEQTRDIERTNASLAELDRQRDLKRLLSAQNAAFSSSGFSTTSSSFGAASQSDLDRLFEERRRASISSRLTQKQLDEQIDQQLLAGQAAKAQGRTRAVLGGLQTVTSLASLGARYKNG